MPRRCMGGWRKKLKFHAFSTSAPDGSKSRRRRWCYALLLHRVDVFSVPEVSKVHPASIFRLYIEDGVSLYLRNVDNSVCILRVRRPRSRISTQQFLKPVITEKLGADYCRLSFLSFPLISGKLQFHLLHVGVKLGLCHIQLFSRLLYDAVSVWTP